MSILGFIGKQKERFRSYKVENEKRRILEDSAKLKTERIRQGELAKANAVYQKERRDLDLIKGYNDKIEATRPNFLRNLGEGLAKANNKRSEFKAKMDKKNKGKKDKGPRIRTNTLLERNQGSKGLEFGGNSGGSNFNSGARPFEFGSNINEGSPFNQGGKRRLL